MNIDKLKQLAEYIVLSEFEDIEFLSVWEIMNDKLAGDWQYKTLSESQQHELSLKLDKLVRTAIITVDFPEESDAS